MIIDLGARPARLAAAAVIVSLLIALFWELLPAYGVGPPFGLPQVIVLCADLLAVLTLAALGVALVATITGWAIALDQKATRRWQGMTAMSLDFYLARYDHSNLFAPNLDSPRRVALLATLESIRVRGDSTVFVLLDDEAYTDRIIVMTRASVSIIREWAHAMSADEVSRLGRADRRELMRRYPGLAGSGWWISWD